MKYTKTEHSENIFMIFRFTAMYYINNLNILPKLCVCMIMLYMI